MIFISEEERKARLEADAAGKQAGFEDAWARIVKGTPGPIVRVMGAGQVHMHANGRSLTFDRRDLLALELVVLALRGEGDR
jgi:hypothetical protein